LLEHDQVGDGALREGEGGERNHARGVIDKGDQVGLTDLAGVLDLGSVHHVAHPQVACSFAQEAAPVFTGRIFGALLHQTALGEHPVHGGLGEHDLVADEVYMALARNLDQSRNAQCVVILFELAQQVDDGLGDGARAALVAACTWHQCVEPAAAVRPQPATDGLRGDAAAQRAGDGVLALGLVLQQRVEAAVMRLEMSQVGDCAIAEQRHLPARFVHISKHSFIRRLHAGLLSLHCAGRFRCGQRQPCECRLGAQRPFRVDPRYQAPFTRELVQQIRAASAVRADAGRRPRATRPTHDASTALRASS
jgi:hypothetical protein